MKCRDCGKEIKIIRVGNRSIPVNLGTTYVVPSYSTTQNTFVATYGAFIKGDISDDGIECYSIHRCKINTKTTDERGEKSQEKFVKKYVQLSLF